MDPLQALKNSAEALAFQDYPQALELLLGYYQWRIKGGFEPTNINNKRGDEFAESLGIQILDGMPEARK